MKVKIEIEGLKELNSHLDNLARGSEEVLAEVINDVLYETQAYAVKSMRDSPPTGRTYEKGNPKRTHTASSPGNPPRPDEGRLLSNVHVEPATRAQLLGRVGTAILYGPHLEFGTSKMAARPWLLPAFQRAIADIEQDLKRKMEARKK